MALKLGSVVYEVDELGGVFSGLPLGTVMETLELDGYEVYFVRWDGDTVTDSWPYRSDQLQECGGTE